MMISLNYYSSSSLYRCLSGASNAETCFLTTGAGAGRLGATICVTNGFELDDLALSFSFCSSFFTAFFTFFGAIVSFPDVFAATGLLAAFVSALPVVFTTALACVVFFLATGFAEVLVLPVVALAVVADVVFALAGAAFLATTLEGAAFLGAAFFAGAGFLGAAFFGAAFLGMAFLGAAFFTTFFATGRLATDFFGAAF